MTNIGIAIEEEPNRIKNNAINAERVRRNNLKDRYKNCDSVGDDEEKDGIVSDKKPLHAETSIEKAIIPAPEVEGVDDAKSKSCLPSRTNS